LVPKIDFLSRNKQYVEYCFQNVQKGCVRFGTDFTDIAFEGQKKMGYIALVEDFTEFGLASKNFSRVCPFGHGLHGHWL